MSFDLSCAMMALCAIVGFGFVSTCRMLSRVENAVLDVYFCIMDGDDRELRCDEGESWKTTEDSD